jgi:magnesium chelatase family protein
MEKISGPILDRIDLCVHMNDIPFFDLAKEKESESSANIKQRVDRAVEVQRERYKHEKICFNSQLDGEKIRKYCFLGKEETEVLKQVYEKMELSVRSYEKILKTARTIADLKEHEKIDYGDIAEAVSYKTVSVRGMG